MQPDDTNAASACQFSSYRLVQDVETYAQLYQDLQLELRGISRMDVFQKVFLNELSGRC